MLNGSFYIHSIVSATLRGSDLLGLEYLLVQPIMVHFSGLTMMIGPMNY